MELGGGKHDQNTLYEMILLNKNLKFSTETLDLQLEGRLKEARVSRHEHWWEPVFWHQCSSAQWGLWRQDGPLAPLLVEEGGLPSLHGVCFLSPEVRPAQCPVWDDRCQRDQGLAPPFFPDPSHQFFLFLPPPALRQSLAYPACGMGMSYRGSNSWLKPAQKRGCRVLCSLLHYVSVHCATNIPLWGRPVGIMSSAFSPEEERTLPCPHFKKKIPYSLSQKCFGNKLRSLLYVSQLHKKSKHPVFQNLSS